MYAWADLIDTIRKNPLTRETDSSKEVARFIIIIITSIYGNYTV